MITQLSENSLQNISKTQKARELIVEELKTNQPLQHKEIIKRLNEVKEETTGKTFFSNGNINGAFVSLNKNMRDLNITKYRKDGGVYYEYITDTTDSSNIENANLTTLNELLDNLKECFNAANLLKSEILSGEFEKSDEVLNLISKINDLEFFVLQNEF
ncbi:hypothetical protein ACUXCC_004892 [Cytobacillus horneckiae]|uniref:hypothetical protein n=1 Tax=Cytobacillus horneckiae TaxID=549687 RepID=UPI0019D1DA42|nr:hypothetical protein [Cytobacillus horneckiae]MBN6889588.1 hypothetical protein [Cytobacillus horneckiae]MCM3180940.1 hypothetical protein [Cytobacillus horneckiae]